LGRRRRGVDRERLLHWAHAFEHMIQPTFQPGGPSLFFPLFYLFFSSRRDQKYRSEFSWHRIYCAQPSQLLPELFACTCRNYSELDWEALPGSSWSIMLGSVWTTTVGGILRQYYGNQQVVAGSETNFYYVPMQTWHYFIFFTVEQGQGNVKN